MAYEDGSNTWPTGAVDIGKTYGPRFVGDVRGVVKTEGNKNEVTYEFTAGTTDAPYTYTLPPFYLIQSITLEVEEAFAASSEADITVDGGAGLTTPMDLTAKTVEDVPLTGLANTAGDDSATSFPLNLVLDANAKASATGKARVVVQYFRT